MQQPRIGFVSLGCPKVKIIDSVLKTIRPICAELNEKREPLAPFYK